MNDGTIEDFAEKLKSKLEGIMGGDVHVVDIGEALGAEFSKKLGDIVERVAPSESEGPEFPCQWPQLKDEDGCPTRLLAFLYRVLRDVGSPGDIEQILMDLRRYEPDDRITFCNSYLEGYARTAASYLIGEELSVLADAGKALVAQSEMQAEIEDRLRAVGIWQDGDSNGWLVISRLIAEYHALKVATDSPPSATEAGQRQEAQTLYEGLAVEGFTVALRDAERKISRYERYLNMMAMVEIDGCTDPSWFKGQASNALRVPEAAREG